jgi:hypothetical protein
VITDGPIILGLAAGALALDTVVELADIEGDESAARTIFDIAAGPRPLRTGPFGVGDTCKPTWLKLVCTVGTDTSRRAVRRSSGPEPEWRVGVTCYQ